MKRSHGLYPMILAAAFLLAGLMSGTDGRASDANPCSEDIAKFCPDVKAGEPAFLDCLERHESQLSDACKAYEAKLERPRTESREMVRQQMRIRQACRDDVAKFCKNLKPGGDGIAACLDAHENELSQPCRDAVEAARAGAE